MSAFYFGAARDAPAWRSMAPIATPAGAPCTWCSEPIKQGDDGIVDAGGHPYHANCWIRQVSGGVNHLQGTCTCRGGKDPADPPDMTLRQAADKAVELFEQGHL